MAGTSDHHPIPGIPVKNCTRQLGIPGPWHTHLTHFRMDFNPSNGAELQTEYFVPRQPDWPNVKALLPTIEVRPHWAKLFTLSPAYLQTRYQQSPDFQHLLQTHDPTSKFRNHFLNTYIFD